jgi:hypothetical protein
VVLHSRQQLLEVALLARQAAMQVQRLALAASKACTSSSSSSSAACLQARPHWLPTAAQVGTLRKAAAAAWAQTRKLQQPLLQACVWQAAAVALQTSLAAGTPAEQRSTRLPLLLLLQMAARKVYAGLGSALDRCAMTAAAAVAAAWVVNGAPAMCPRWSL